MKHRITIQRPMTAVNAQGGKIKVWVDVATVWASLEPLSGREIVENFQKEPEITTRFFIRYRKLLVPSMRIKFGNRYFKIVSPPINHEEKNESLEILAEETKDFD